MIDKRRSYGAPAADAAVSADAIQPGADALVRQFEEFGLSTPCARVLLALLQCGRATASQLGRASGVNRTSTYQMLEALRAKGVAEQLPGKFAVWSSPGVDATLERLVSAQQANLRRLEAGVDDVREQLAQLVPAEPLVTVSPMQLIANAAQVRRAFSRFVNEAKSEILIMHLPPYAFGRGRVNQEGMEALSRGVSCRALYQAADLQADEARAFREEHETYMRDGLKARVLDELPVKLAVFDRERGLLTARARSLGDYPTTLLMTDRGCAAALVASFERFWDAARPYRPAPAASQGSPRGSRR